LRPLADEADLPRIEDALRTDCDVPNGPWLSRQKGLQAKLTASDPVQLAEIVAEGAKRGRLRLEAGNKGPLSPGEGSFFVKLARSSLVRSPSLAASSRPRRTVGSTSSSAGACDRTAHSSQHGRSVSFQESE
jgi:hypothetical protein